MQLKLTSDRDALDTYRYLRMAMPLLVVLLASSVAYQIFKSNPDCWLGSISAYYYTSARAVFVACLCTMGASLIIYSGNTPKEDFVLNLSGLLAFVVAFVPTPLKDLVISPVAPAHGEPVCKRSNVPQGTQLTDAIANNVFALLVTATAALVVIWVFRFVRASGGVGQRIVHALLGSVAAGGLLMALVVAWLVLWLDSPLIRHSGHIAAASTMFAGIVIVVLINAVEATGRPKVWYWVTLGLMGTSIVALGLLALSGASDHAVFWLEASLITLFGVFWIVQTTDLWGQEQRGQTLDQVAYGAPED